MLERAESQAGRVTAEALTGAFQEHSQTPASDSMNRLWWPLRSKPLIPDACLLAHTTSTHTNETSSPRVDLSVSGKQLPPLQARCLCHHSKHFFLKYFLSAWWSLAFQYPGLGHIGMQPLCCKPAMVSLFIGSVLTPDRWWNILKMTHGSCSLTTSFLSWET